MCFVLLTHRQHLAVQRLVARLLAMFDEPTIVCHHDFGKVPLDTLSFPAVAFVRPHHDTTWGRMSVVRAILAALRIGLNSPREPEWFVLLSGADYPIRKAEQIERELTEGGYDAYVQHEWIQPRRFERAWQQECYERYYGRTVKLARVERRRRLRWRVHHIHSRRIPGFGSPFSDEFRCYAGETWFTANRCAVRYVLEFHVHNPPLARWYERKSNVDESYVQTILGNAPGLRLCGDPKRYTDWSEDEPHPKTLTLEDLPTMVQSGAHFARKFEPGMSSALLDQLDEALR